MSASRELLETLANTAEDMERLKIAADENRALVNQTMAVYNKIISVLLEAHTRIALGRGPAPEIARAAIVRVDAIRREHFL